MVPIVKQLCPPERYGIKCPVERKPRFIVVHNTGDGASAANEVAYMINRPEEISFHEAVDDKEIRQGLPFDRNAWASGDGWGDGNIYGIHIEICYSNYVEDNTSLSPKEIYEKFAVAEENAAEHIASLLKEYGWGMDKVTKHQDYDGKYCPHRTLDLGWGRFLKMIEKYYEEDEEMTDEKFAEFMERYKKRQAEKPAGKWAEGNIEKVKEQGIMTGDGNGNFRPQSSITRQEVATVAANILGKLEAVLDKLEVGNEKI